jgi:hypothetical protein
MELCVGTAPAPARDGIRPPSAVAYGPGWHHFWKGRDPPSASAMRTSTRVVIVKTASLSMSRCSQPLPARYRDRAANSRKPAGPFSRGSSEIPQSGNVPGASAEGAQGDRPSQPGRRLSHRAGAFVSCGMPVGPGSGGDVEAKFPREIGLIAQYEIDARGYVVPSGDGSEVTLRGEERALSGPAVKPDIRRKDVTNRGDGRNLRVWRAFVHIADSLGRVQAATDSGLSGQFVGSTATKVFSKLAATPLRPSRTRSRCSFHLRARPRGRDLCGQGRPVAESLERRDPMTKWEATGAIIRVASVCGAMASSVRSAKRGCSCEW